MNKEIYIDFDGVIADTQKKIDYYFSLFDNTITPEWNKFLANINWKRDVLSDCNEIRNSFAILKDLYKMKKNIYILSRVFSLNEAKDKLEFLRDNGVNMTFIPSPGRIKKSEIIIPNKEKILIDDSKDNVLDWINNNGRGIYFTNNLVDLVVSKNFDFNDKQIYYDQDQKPYFKETTDDLSFLLKKKI